MGINTFFARYPIVVRIAVGYTLILILLLSLAWLELPQPPPPPLNLRKTANRKKSAGATPASSNESPARAVGINLHLHQPPGGKADQPAQQSLFHRRAKDYHRVGHRRVLDQRLMVWRPNPTREPQWPPMTTAMANRPAAA